MNWNRQERRDLSTRIEILEFMPETELDRGSPPEANSAGACTDLPELDPSYWFI